jgi:hypothetical protein
MTMIKTTIDFGGRRVDLEFESDYYKTIDDVVEACGARNKINWICDASKAVWADTGEPVRKKGEYGRRLAMRLVEERVVQAKKILAEAKAIAADGGVTFVIDGGTFGDKDGNYMRDVILTNDGQWVVTEDAWSASGLSC